jgi:drug/metabolite transporter (DMT)-like permease
LKPIFKNPVSSNLFKAGILRSTASMIVTSYSPVFFQKVFTNYKMAAILAGLGVRAKNSLV